MRDAAIVESASEGGAIVGLEQLVAASLQERRCATARRRTPAPRAPPPRRTPRGAADGEGACARAGITLALAGMQLQQQLAQLAAAAYPAFHVPGSRRASHREGDARGPGAAREARAAAPGRAAWRP